MSDDFNPASAAALIEAESGHVRRSLNIRLHQQLLLWGAAWVVGLGLIWWQVRSQHPYMGPDGTAAALFGVLLAVAAVFTTQRTAAATHGLHGDLRWRSLVYGIAWTLGFVTLFVFVGALAHRGVGPQTIALVSTCGAMGVTGLMYCAGAAIWGSRPLCVLGVWLLLLAACAGFAGPVGAVALGAFAGGGGFFAVAGWLLWRRERSGGA